MIETPEPSAEAPSPYPDPEPHATIDNAIAATITNETNFFFISITPPSKGLFVFDVRMITLPVNICQSVDIYFTAENIDFVNFSLFQNVVFVQYHNKIRVF